MISLPERSAIIVIEGSDRRRKTSLARSLARRAARTAARANGRQPVFERFYRDTRAYALSDAAFFPVPARAIARWF